MTFLPLDIDEESFNVSKTMIRILRHRGLYREKDGAVEWRRWLPMLCRKHPNALKMDASNVERPSAERKRREKISVLLGP